MAELHVIDEKSNFKLIGENVKEGAVQYGQKLNNLFSNAKKAMSRQDLIKTVKMVAAGIRHIVWLAAQAGICIIGLALHYINLFVSYLASKVSAVAAKLAKKELTAATK